MQRHHRFLPHVLFRVTQKLGHLGEHRGDGLLVD